MTKYRRVVKPKVVVHMLREKKNSEVKTRCRKEFTLEKNETVHDIGVTGWEKLVTCPECLL